MNLSLCLRTLVTVMICGRPVMPGAVLTLLKTLSSALHRDWFSNVRGDLLAGLVVALALIPAVAAGQAAG